MLTIIKPLIKYLIFISILNPVFFLISKLILKKNGKLSWIKAYIKVKKKLLVLELALLNRIKKI